MKLNKKDILEKLIGFYDKDNKPVYYIGECWSLYAEPQTFWNVRDKDNNTLFNGNKKECFDYLKERVN